MKKKILTIRIPFTKKTESNRHAKWRKLGKTTVVKRGAWTRTKLEFIKDFDVRVYMLGLKSLKGK